MKVATNPALLKIITGKIYLYLISVFNKHMTRLEVRTMTSTGSHKWYRITFFTLTGAAPGPV